MGQDHCYGGLNAVVAAAHLGFQSTIALREHKYRLHNTKTTYFASHSYTTTCV